MRIGLVSYGAGNVRSVQNALELLGCEVVTSSSIEELESAEKIVFPGVGEASSAMSAINSAGLGEWLTSLQKPYLGICLGMQVLFERSAERNTACLGILEGSVTTFEDVKVPHMGWNRIDIGTPSPLFDGIPDGSYFYFAHSYCAPLSLQTLATTTHGRQFTCAVRTGNKWGVQFHPEKSGTLGLSLLRNFIDQC